MLRIPVTILALYASILSAFSQGGDTTQYENRKLKVDEVNFVSSYYRQDGNNAAVTGGVGSEKLTDFATTIDVHLLKTDRKQRVNSYTIELGIDTYTSASSDKIDPSTVSSASSGDQRIYPSVSWSRINQSKGSTIGANFSVSSEYDYFSLGGGIIACRWVYAYRHSRMLSRLFTPSSSALEGRAGQKGGIPIAPPCHIHRSSTGGSSSCFCSTWHIRRGF
jgi:hypothetical protein